MSACHFMISLSRIQFIDIHVAQTGDCICLSHCSRGIASSLLVHCNASSAHERSRPLDNRQRYVDRPGQVMMTRSSIIVLSSIMDESAHKMFHWAKHVWKAIHYAAAMNDRPAI